jgi:hypothetical protein
MSNSAKKKRSTTIGSDNINTPSCTDLIEAASSAAPTSPCQPQLRGLR